jgi:NADH-quinone oxidoreductase subunit F/NADP-reducing hydrogenase subunit HndC
MKFLKYDANKCILCRECIQKCPFGALTMEASGIEVGENCKMCGVCVRNCPVGAITGTVKEPHVIDTTKCIKCGVCQSNCKFDAISFE